MKILTTIITCLLFTLFSCKDDSPAEPTPSLQAILVQSVTINSYAVSNKGTVYNIPIDSVLFHITFSNPIDPTKLDSSKIFVSNDIGHNYTIIPSANPNELVLKLKSNLNYYKSYVLYILDGDYLGASLKDSYQYTFITELDPTPKFPAISNDSLLTLVQKKTFDYFWLTGHPVSGLARERLGSGDIVTSGGSGFCIMGIPVAIERGFITRQQGFERMNTIVNFLQNTETDKFHGAFPHWFNGTTGKVIPFGTKDDGADLVETAFLMQGLLTVQEYFKNGNTEEQTLCQNIETLYENVEWSWFQKNNEQVLYWHWSPNYNWDMNMPVRGWNEGLIIYVLAAASPTHPINKTVYEQGWARNGDMKNDKSFYNIVLPLGEDKGGPMFFAHYSFLGLNPTNLVDQYANYWQQNTAHAQINYQYCVTNPKHYFGYSTNCWGLTASDIQNSYTASSPNNDVGVIAPTAALASFPYTPNESTAALNFFYYTLGDKLFGDYGFKDAFNLQKNWFATSYLAIDQGPIVVMIENHRTKLCWNLFMQNSHVQTGLTNLGFTY